VPVTPLAPSNGQLPPVTRHVCVGAGFGQAAREEAHPRGGSPGVSAALHRQSESGVVDRCNTLMVAAQYGSVEVRSRQGPTPRSAVTTPTTISMQGLGAYDMHATGYAIVYLANERAPCGRGWCGYSNCTSGRERCSAGWEHISPKSILGREGPGRAERRVACVRRLFPKLTRLIFSLVAP
jgi:hypothetical protein